MFTPFVLSQILAALGICTDVTGWQFKSRVTVLLFLVGSSFFFAAHFYVLGQSLSALATVIGAAGYVVSIFSPSRLAMCIFIGLVLGMFLFIGNLGVLPIFSLLAALFSTIGSFRKTDKYLRIWKMGGSLLWLTHNIILVTPVAILAELLAFFGNAVGYWRHYLKQRTKSDS